MKKLSVGIIGLGYWGPNIVRNLIAISKVSQIYGCDIKKDRTNDLKKLYPSVHITNNFQTLLENPTLDAVIVATPINTHYALAKKALLAKKHILIEKPMTVTSREAKELISLAKKMNVVLMVGHTFVYSETVKKIKNIIQKGGLGNTYYYDSTRINLGLIQNDSNVIWDLAPHDLSIVNYLFKEKPLSVQAFGSSFISNNLEIAHIFIRFEKNISAHIHVSWLSPVKIRSILIGGSKKMIVYNDLEPTEKIKIYDKGVIPAKDKITPFSPAYRSGDVIIPHLEQKEALLNELSHFVECIMTNKVPISDGTSGLNVVKLLEAIDLALKTKKEIIIHD